MLENASLSDWFDHQLRATLDGLLWAVHQLAEERWYERPPAPLGEWSAAEHVYHMLHYEKRLALPTMYQWLGEPPAITRARPDEKIGPSAYPMEAMLQEFEQVRRTQIDMLPKFDKTSWNSTQRTEVWGEVSLYWLVCKTYQHTADHTKSLLALTLFWDRTVARLARNAGPM